MSMSQQHKKVLPESIVQGQHPGLITVEAKRQPFVISTVLLATPEERVQRVSICKKCENLVLNGNNSTIHSTLAYSRCRCHRIFKYREVRQQQQHGNGMVKTGSDEMKSEGGWGSLTVKGPNCRAPRKCEHSTESRGGNMSTSAKRIISGVRGQRHALLTRKTKSSMSLAVPEPKYTTENSKRVVKEDRGRVSQKANAGVVLPVIAEQRVSTASGILKSETLLSPLHIPSLSVVDKTLSSTCKLPPITRYVSWCRTMMGL